ncbi:MAG: KamA family radical SAM protein [Magnetococcales bacterium]|nr:KamA family radical SAM protein [Magnetococcales bacterium]
MTITYGRLTGISNQDLAHLGKVEERYPFRATDYYLSLIDWNDPNDPLKRIVIPSPEELISWGSADPSREHRYTVLPGLEHKYPTTVLLLVSETCAGICRYCFRKRIFQREVHERLENLDIALDYVKEHPEITNVLLTGGDPLCLSTERLTEILGRLRAIDHVGIIRIGSKTPAFNPHRILEDPDFSSMLSRFSTPWKRIYLTVHFDHPRELTSVSVAALDLLMRSGVILVNQTPLIRGINDDADVLERLFRQLSFIGVAPYYLFQCRPTMANRPFVIPIEEGYALFSEAMGRVSGLAKRVRYVISHESGKLEVVGMNDRHVHFRYHRAAESRNRGRFLKCRRNPQALWMDDYSEWKRETGAS